MTGRSITSGESLFLSLKTERLIPPCSSVIDDFGQMLTHVPPGMPEDYTGAVAEMKLY